MSSSAAPASAPRSAPPGPGAPQSQVLAMERRVAEFWAREDIPGRALALHPNGPIFRFTEGPPTANGKPHVGHLMPRALKDFELRYRRMKGDRLISSMAGWDCHGLPVEVEIEKSHGWTNKKQILEYGIGPFAQDCRKSVMKYADIWQQFSERIGFWLDYAHPYFTMDPWFMESVWWSLKELYTKGLLEKGHYVVPYCPRCETPEATHEVAQGYRDTTDPSVTLRLRLTDGPAGGRTTYLLVWTTTPWTLPSNLAVAVGSEMDYVAFEGEGGDEYLLAESALARYFPSEEGRPKVVRREKGSSLVGRTYEPPFPGMVGATPQRFRTYAATFVTAEEGTGLVHVAPSFGVDDYQLGEKVGLGVFDPLDSSGRFTSQVPLVAGKWFKEADKLLMEELHARGVLWRRSTYKHTYPFCWRCDRPLMYRALDTWFVRTHKIREKLLANNAQVTWDPAHLKDGRFGNFVAEGKDWALSRNRYWGTPLPIWNCPKGHQVAVGSFEELSKLHGGPLPTSFDPHRPTVDELSLTCPEHREPLVREPYVIDTWYDSGSAPFAQFHWPFAKGTPFEVDAPLDFVAEAIDQTRGWFYTLLVISTALFDRPPFRHVLCHGHGLDDEGKKMSKSKGNVDDPMQVLERMGADPTRLTIYLSSYTESFRLGDLAIRQGGLRMLTTLLNVLEFYRSNWEVDRVPPAVEAPAPKDPLDRWLLSRLSDVVATTDQALLSFDARRASSTLEAFVQEISTWWLRRSRPRFWEEGPSERKVGAYRTLSFVLLTLGGLLAPLAPYTAEELHQKVSSTDFGKGASSVHLEPFPSWRGARDLALETAMSDVLALVETVRRLRMEAGVRARMPLEELLVGGLAPGTVEAMGPSLVPLLQEELNVKRVEMMTAERSSTREFPSDRWVVHRPTESGGPSVALSRKPSRELFLEGLAREVVRRVQMTRKELRLAISDRIRLELWAEGDLAEAVQAHQEWISKECLVSDLAVASGSPSSPEGVRSWPDVEGSKLELRIVKAPKV
ncbi:MAG: isoleucine--tRNA ligase [Euryarchaeota archaeon]|nr:isoleucine--tRNA ligase [Euryarchaeota archaeon]